MSDYPATLKDWANELNEVQNDNENMVLSPAQQRSLRDQIQALESKVSELEKALEAAVLEADLVAAEEEDS